MSINSSFMITSNSRWVLNTYSTNYIAHGIIVGNCDSLSILYSCIVSIPTCHSSLSKTNVLHTPRVKTNLLYIRQLCQDNNVYVEFHFSFFCVKNKVLRRVILQFHLIEAFKDCLLIEALLCLMTSQLHTFLMLHIIVLSIFGIKVYVMFLIIL